MSATGGISLSYDDGVHAVELARSAVEKYVVSGKRKQLGSMREAFYARTGAFVRLESTRGRGQLRGCAGDYDDSDHLGKRVVEAAIEAASPDSCGSGIGPSELSSIAVSVCVVRDVVLTDDPATDLQLGRHGVAVDAGENAGWLYPTVPVDYGWSVEEYLRRTCRTADLAPDAWRDDDVAVTLFAGQVFRERTPDGSVEALDGHR